MRIIIQLSGKELVSVKADMGTAAEWLIGREPSAALFVGEKQISRKHALLKLDGKGQITITDLGSTNGTFINGQKLTPQQAQVFTKADTVRLAENSGIQLVIVENETSFQQIPSPEKPIPVAPVREMQVPEAPKPSVSLSDNTQSTADILEKLRHKNPIVIGRSTDCDVVLSHPAISRRHAAVEKKPNGTYVLTDLNSTNGTFHNGKRISGSVIVNESDVFFIGRYSLSLGRVAKDLSQEVAVRAQAVRKEFSNGKVGLHDCTFDINAKALLAIMGPSGCGKSTLLKALNGDSPATAGAVYICGLELNANFDYLKTQIGYVPQDDIVHMDLTVEQCLTYAARLRLEHATEELIAQKIEQVLAQLKIEHIRHNMVGRISGGQRKRVSIAVEILNDPMILFLDEPTSPLDPQTIEEFLGILRSLAEKGTTVIMVTHKTDDLHFMDSVIFMAEGGNMAYYGDTKNYLSYFGVKNTVNVYSNLSGEKAKTWAQAFLDKHGGMQNPMAGTPVLRKSQSTNYFRQYKWLTHRYFRIKLNDQVNTMIMIGQAPVIALLLCLIFKHVNQTVLFLMAISGIWFGANNAAREIVGEMPVYKRERMFNLGILPYIFSKATVLGAFAALQSFIFVLIVQVRYPEWNDTGGAFAWMLFLSFTATLLGLMLSAVVNTTEKVMSIVPIVLIPQIMLSGVFVKIQSSLVELISYLTISRWGTEGFSIIQREVHEPKPLLNENGIVVLDPHETVPVNALQNINKQFHEDFTQFYGSMQADIIAVSIIAFILFIGIYHFLKKKDSIKIG